MEEVKQKNWFSRNWLWVLPVGGCLTVIVLFVFGIGALFVGVTSALKNSTPFEYALQQTKENPDVKLAIGDNIETNGILSGNISFKNNTGVVDIKQPIKGDKGEAILVVKGDKIDDEWIYEELYVLIKETQEKINLLDKSLEGI